MEEILYKKGKGGLLVWKILVEARGGGAAVITTRSGKLDGALTESFEEISRGRGGQTAFSRAKSLVSTKVKNKIETGYCRTVEEAERGSDALDQEPMPMCFKSIEPTLEAIKAAGIQYPVVASVKLNGVAGVYYPATGRLCSRKRKTLNVPHILEEMKARYPKEGCESRGIKLVHFEFWVPELRVNEINSLVKRNRPESKRLLAVVHDLGMEGRPTGERNKLRHEMFDGQGKGKKSCVEDHKREEVLLTPEKLFEYFKGCVETGEEGVCYRSSKEIYLFDNNTRRSANVGKIKPVYSKEFRVTAVTYDQRTEKVDGVNVTYMLCEFHCVTEEGKAFKAIPAWSHPRRHQFYIFNRNNEEGWIEELPPLTCEYREVTTDGAPFHAVAIDFREDV